MEPFPDPGVADGLALSSSVGETNVCRDICRELERSGIGKRERRPSLVDWAEQGVLLLNAALTTQIHGYRDHQNVWHENFVKSVLSACSNDTSKKVFVCLGKDPRVIAEGTSVGNHIKVFNVDPPGTRGSKFVGSDVFKHINEYLKFVDVPPVKWV